MKTEKNVKSIIKDRERKNENLTAFYINGITPKIQSAPDLSQKNSQILFVFILMIAKIKGM